MAYSEYCCNAYDFHINDSHELAIHTYKVGLENKKVLNKRRSYYVFYPYQEELSIDHLNTLKKDGYIPYHNFDNDNQIEICNINPVIDLKLKILNIHHKLLERIYDLVIIDGKSVVFTYLTYVNIFNGNMYMMNMGMLDYYNESIINHLDELGYIDVANSSLSDIMDNININSKKDVPINRVLAKKE